VSRVQRKRRGFGAVRQLRSGRFQASYVGPDGIRLLSDTTFTTTTNADVWLSTVRADIVRRAWKAPHRETERVETYVQRWIEQRHGLKDTTRALYRNVFARTIQHSAIGSLRLSELTPDRVRTWHHELGEAKRAELAARRQQAEQAGRVHSQATTRTGAALVRQAFLLLRAALATAVSDARHPRPLTGRRASPQPTPQGQTARSIRRDTRVANVPARPAPSQSRCSDVQPAGESVQPHAYGLASRPSRRLGKM